MYKPEGSLERAKIAFIGEAPSTQEIVRGRPFVGPAGKIFDACLQHAKIIRSDCYITNAFPRKVWKDRKSGSIFASEEDFFAVTKEHRPAQSVLLWKARGGLTEDGLLYSEPMRAEIEQCKANVIVPLGGVALNATVNVSAITAYRGSVLESSRLSTPRKLLPTLHPSSVLQGQPLNQYMIRRDFLRAAKQAEFPEIRRPPYRFTLMPTLSELLEGMRWVLSEKPTIAMDIEVRNGHMSLCCLSWSRYDSLVIAFDDNWSLRQEAEIWKTFAQICEDEDIHKIFQNGIFDMTFLLTQYGIMVRGPLDDTMVMHSMMYPDFPKGLAFLASIYTEQPYYKNMVKHDPLSKKEG